MEQFVDENNYPLFDGIVNLKREGGVPTAMQEFFMVLKEFNKDLYNTMYNEGILDNALEKEKEQMFFWYYGGGSLSAADDFREEFEKNYNQIYNQNK
jgi:hypothetical protein